MLAPSSAGREIVVIQGYTGDEGEEGYPRLSAGLLAAGAAAVHSIAPDYRGRSSAAWMADVAVQVEARDVPANACLLGHSFGAILAAAEAARRTYGGLVLCSLTPTGVYMPHGSPAANLRVAEAVGGQELFEILLNTDTDPWLKYARVPVDARHVLLESDNDFMEPLHLRAQSAAEILGTQVTRVPQSRHNLEAYPTYIKAAVLATGLAL